ncbi:ATP-binding protein [Thauera sinica]|uniref:histidine kinase n=1 Tax=Thauera sinica TaxID=2665146 RepID=A0ABW1AXU0_9RHOO|nr:ATP-binding protein [Thauera sp. K11]ATE60218.1 two-component sensor histidine kinase [Thauera sp. K11]
MSGFPRALAAPLSRWLPRSLLWQTFLLVGLLLIVALGVWSQIFRYFEEPARARDVAQMVASVVNLTRTALINADAERRIDLLIELAALEGIRIYPAEPSDDVEPLPDTRPLRLLTTHVRQQLGEHTRFAVRWKSLDGFWVSFRLDPDDGSDEYWVMLPADRIEQRHAFEWLAWGSAALLVALAGAYLIVSRISRPLRNLTRAALMVGSGRTPPVQQESGPQEIAVVARAFNRMAGELARTDADRALILAGVSHDLRTPLARLRLGVEMSGAPAGEVLAMVADIEEMDRIIGQFLDFGRGDAQEPTQQVDLATLAREITEPYRLRGLDVRLDAPDTLVAEARALPMRRALANLVDNALRYAGEDEPVDVSVYPAGNEACIEVADRGPGIPSDQVERMRHPFTRLEEARSNTKGAGLGLAIVDRVMRAHQGRLDLSPREGGGLRAILCLPYSGNAPAQARISSNDATG